MFELDPSDKFNGRWCHEEITYDYWVVNYIQYGMIYKQKEQ